MHLYRFLSVLPFVGFHGAFASPLGYFDHQPADIVLVKRQQELCPALYPSPGPIPYLVFPSSIFVSPSSTSVSSSSTSVSSSSNSVSSSSTSVSTSSTSRSTSSISVSSSSTSVSSSTTSISSSSTSVSSSISVSSSSSSTSVSVQTTTTAATTTTTKTTTTVTTTTSSGPWSSLGCYTDSIDARALPNSATASDMSVSKCEALAAGHKYAGVEYGTECHWGDVIASSSTQAPSGCDMACAGKSTELCGGGNRINIYLNTAFSNGAQGGNDWVYTGCYTDDANARSIGPGTITDWSAMTVENCLRNATGFKYAAVEYYGECYWGNQLGGSLASGSDCNTPCTGNSNEMCGGGNRLSVYLNAAYQAPASKRDPNGQKTKELAKRGTDVKHIEVCDVKYYSNTYQTGTNGGTYDSYGYKYNVNSQSQCYWSYSFISPSAPGVTESRSYDAEHVYEAQIVSQFIEYVGVTLDGRGRACRNSGYVMKYFARKTPFPGKNVNVFTGGSAITELMSNLPSDTSGSGGTTEMVALDSELNGLKASVFIGGAGFSAYSLAPENLARVTQFAMLHKYLNTPEVITIFKDTSKRMRATLRKLDNEIATSTIEKPGYTDDNGVDHEYVFADEYKQWESTFLLARFGAVDAAMRRCIGLATTQIQADQSIGSPIRIAAIVRQVTDKTAPGTDAYPALWLDLPFTLGA